jgi:cytoskeleton protein RodZ
MTEAPQAAAQGDGVTAGMLLRRAREAAGLHIATLAVSLKVPVRKLEALEEDRYDQLSDAVFVRALASSVCRTLKVDPHPVLDRLPLGEKPRLVQASDGINTPFRPPGEGAGPNIAGQVSRPVVFAVALLLLGTLVIVFLPTLRREEPLAAVQPSRAEAPAAAQIAAVPPPDATSASLASAAAASAAAALPAMAPASVSVQAASGAPAAVPAASAAVPAASVAMAAASASPAASAASLAQAPASGIVVFRTHSQSWIEVRDAGGKAVLRKLMDAGDTAGATGALPLSVTVGSAPATEVLVRGQPYDMSAVTKDNVARFEVK